MKIILWGFLLAASAALAAGCHSDETVQSATVQSVPSRIVESSEQQAPIALRATGTLHARETAVISAQTMGRIEQVLVRAGDSVRPGQTLVVLDGAALQASAAQAQAAIVAAENQQAAAESNAGLAASTLARYKQLQAEKSVSPQEMDEVTRRAQGAQAQLDAAKAQTEAAREQAAAARTMLSYTRIAAPFAGIVTSRTADPGTIAAPGVPLLQIDRSGPLQLQAAVDESAIAAVRLGLKTPVTMDGVAQPMQGAVAEIVPAADPSSHSFLVKIDLPTSDQLRAGMYGTASIPNGTHRAIVVPRSAVVTRGSLECAYVVDGDGIAQLRYLTLGETHGDLVEVLSGLAAGERLVDTPQDRDFAGKRIEVQP
ncbi:MAG TPA: efflux RND transporter periplasmic adaptor subunit [Terracidiphilus sp.]|nr:efflux RND transporter periplasmic adaptor subunit [Terracidiphilus sp.]